MLVCPLLPSTTLASPMLNDGVSTVVTETAELLGKYGSASARVTVAVFVNIPATVGTTTIVMVALFPPGTVPRLHLTTPADCVQLPCGLVAQTNVTPGGRMFVTTTLVEDEGPAFATVSA